MRGHPKNKDSLGGVLSAALGLGPEHGTIISREVASHGLLCPLSQVTVPNQRATIDASRMSTIPSPVRSALGFHKGLPGVDPKA